MKKATRFLLGIFTFSFLISGLAIGQITVLTDDGSQSTYSDGWGSLEGGGIGWYNWNISYGSDTGTFIASPADDGMDTTGIGTSAFGMYSTGSGYVNARRTFHTGMQVGDTLTFYWAINYDAGGGNKGFDLKDGSTTVINVNNTGSATITSTAGTVSTDYGTNPMLVTVVRTSSSEYSLSITERDGSGTFTGTVSSSTEIDRVDFYIGGQNDGAVQKNMYFNYFEIKSAAKASLTGNEGFRLLSLPLQESYSNFLKPLWTQGMSNSDFVGDENTDGNVFEWANSSTNSDNTNWDEISNLNITPASGKGFLVYVFADDNNDGSADAFPKSLYVSGTENAIDSSPLINSNANGWSLVGNPYANTIDFDDAVKSDLTNVAYVWDDDSSEWKTYETSGGTGDLTGGLIKPFQGFFIQNDASVSSPDITFGAASKSSGGSFYGKVTPPTSRFRLEASGAGLKNSLWIHFSEEGSVLEKVFGDAMELQALSNDFAHLSVNKNNNLMDIAHLPSQIEEPIRIPIEFETTKNGIYTISASQFHLKEDLEIIFNDYENDFTQVIDSDFKYDFRFETVVNKKSIRPNDLINEPILVKSKAEANRFGITIRPTSVSNETEDAPSAFALEQNYPNPFNPSTTISYSVQEAGAVTISVYNLMGQKVATLVDETKAAGQYNVRWNAAGAASGMYYYRLEAGGQSITRKMTLIK